MIDTSVEIEVKREPEFEFLYNLPPDIHTIVCMGGRGGKKTYEVSKFIAYSATIKKKRCVILRDEKSLIKDSILNEVWARYDTANELGYLDQHYNKNDTELKDRKTGKTLIYTKGFRASASEKKANLKGASDIDIAIIEEGEDINDADKFNMFVDSLRKDGCIIIIMLNTPDIGHFILKRYFNVSPIVPPPNLSENEKKEYDGYFEPTPKNLPGVICVQTEFTKNSHLPQNVIDRYNSYGDPLSTSYNLHYYLTAIKGYASSGRKGQILKKVKPIKLADYMALPFKEYYGQDFGTSAPAGMVGVKFDKNNCFCRQINYKPMSTLEIGKLYCSLRLGPADRIVADNADAKAIRKLKDGFEPGELSIEDLRAYPQLTQGFNMIPCTKGTDSIKNGIQLMDGMNLYAVEESVELWDEINNRIYDQDKNGNYTNEPKPGHDHLQDPWFYVVNDQRGHTAIYGY